MFSAIHARLLPRLALNSSISLLARRSVVIPRAFLSRTFLTGTPRLEFPEKKANSTTKKTTSSTKRTTAKKSAKKPVKKPVRKAARKTAAKKKAVTKKKAKPVKFRLTAAQKPPKRPGSGRTLFIRDFILSKDSRSGSVHESRKLLKDASDHYNNLSAEEKLNYQSRSFALKKEWDVAYARWYNTMDPKIIRAVNKSRHLKGKRKLSKPASRTKRPSGAFIRFMRDFESTNPKPTERSKEAGAAWRALPDAEKERFLNEAKADLAKWKQEHSTQ